MARPIVREELDEMLTSFLQKQAQEPPVRVALERILDHQQESEKRILRTFSEHEARDEQRHNDVVEQFRGVSSRVTVIEGKLVSRYPPPPLPAHLKATDSGMIDLREVQEAIAAEQEARKIAEAREDEATKTLARFEEKSERRYRTIGVWAAVLTVVGGVLEWAIAHVVK